MLRQASSAVMEADAGSQSSIAGEMLRCSGVVRVRERRQGPNLQALLDSTELPLACAVLNLLILLVKP